MTFETLGLAPNLLRALTAQGYHTPTPIQSEAIPHLLDGQDLLGIAQTGTGKTAGFALPTLDLLITDPKDPPKRGTRALILAPTRELVAQIADSFQNYGRYIEGLRIARITGGVSMGPQVKKIVPGNDIIVSTPGRLIDLLDRKDIRLGDVEVLILDEADQMMDMGFIHALKKIIPHLPETRQTLLFSATLPPKIVKLANQFLTNPVRVSVTPPNSTAEKVTQSLFYVDPADKPLRLAEHLLRPEVGRALVFTRTKHGADRLVKRLAKVGIGAVAIHGNKSQGARRRALDAFKDGSVMTLVATDVAARGIDIPGVTHVFNYEIPNVPEQYVHRIGRTARADATGEAVSFVARDERAYLKDIHKLLGEAVPEGTAPADLTERMKATEAREAVPIVRLTAEQPTRSGRGKNKRKKKANTSQGKKPSTHKARQQTKPSVERDDRSKPNRKRGRKPKRGQTAQSGNTAKKAAPKPQGNKPQNKSSQGANGFARKPRKASSPTRRKAPSRNSGPKR